MASCRVPAYISYITISHFVASVVYIVVTKAFNYGTPFNDSLTPTQLEIKKTSSRKRGLTFGVAFVVCLVFLFMFQPFVVKKPSFF
jgi:hypothetical protein